MTKVIDFDSAGIWIPCLDQALEPLMRKGVREAIGRAKFEYIDDALRSVFELADREALVNRTIAWVRERTIIAYHGTRLGKSEVKSIRTQGLRPLSAAERLPRIRRALSKHIRWPEVAEQLEETLATCGPKGRYGSRENQVHLTLSRAGLINGFNHYLTYGSEFDQRAAYHLLGEDGVALLEADGSPYVIQVRVPGVRALEAAHPYFSVEDLLSRGDIPNMIRHFMAVWSFRISTPSFSPAALKTDCGLVFFESVPYDWIMACEAWAPDEKKGT